jgi:hypothetical protein
MESQGAMGEVMRKHLKRDSRLKKSVKNAASGPMLPLSSENILSDDNGNIRLEKSASQDGSQDGSQDAGRGGKYGFSKKEDRDVTRVVRARVEWAAANPSARVAARDGEQPRRKVTVPPPRVCGRRRDLAIVMIVLPRRTTGGLVGDSLGCTDSVENLGLAGPSSSSRCHAMTSACHLMGCGPAARSRRGLWRQRCGQGAERGAEEGAADAEGVARALGELPRPLLQGAAHGRPRRLVDCLL